MENLESVLSIPQLKRFQECSCYHSINSICFMACDDFTSDFSALLVHKKR